AVLVGAVAPALLEPGDQTATAASTAAALTRDAATDDLQVGLAAFAKGLDPEDRAPEHHHEADDSEWQHRGGPAVDQRRKPEQHEHHGHNNPPPRMEARIGGANRRGKFCVLGQRPLDLLEQPLLVFGQRHGVPPRPFASGLWSRPTERGRLTAREQVYEWRRK